MHNLLAAFLILLSGWTLSAHAMVLLGRNLHSLLIVAPLVISAAALCYLYLLKRAKAGPTAHHDPAATFSHDLKNDPPPWLPALVCLVPAVLYFSWPAGWALGTAILAYRLVRGGAAGRATLLVAPKTKRSDMAVVVALAIAAVVITLLVVRSDTDDAYYVAVAAATSADPTQPLQAFDPMYGDSGLPLAFPTLRFLSYELFAGAAAYLTGLAAMDVMYIVLPPIWAVFTVLAIFLLAREILPGRWLLLGIVTFLLILILGQTHRAPANMMFVRLFQGKAVYYSIVLPAIFYLTARYFSERGTAADLLLLACSQLGAIGLSQFGMLGAPLAGATALACNAPNIKGPWDRKMLKVLATLLIPLPYLIVVALESHWGAPLADFQTENAAQVWRAIFGKNQQYLVAVLLLMGPVLARDSITRWRLGLPPLIMFAIILNPWLAGFISTYITTPLIYWRLTWAFPALVFIAAAICLMVDRIIRDQKNRWSLAVLSLLVAGLLLMALPYHTLRPRNIGPIHGFALKKIPPDELAVAEKVIGINRNGHRVLAHDRIASIICRFENHPKLVSVRKVYLDTMAPAFGPREYGQRCALYELVSRRLESDSSEIRSALTSLDVGTVVIRQGLESPAARELLTSQGYRRVETLNGFAVWRKVSPEDIPR